MNWIINYSIILNTKIMLSFGFNAGDKVTVLHSKEDNCFYITKINIGDNKLSFGNGNGNEVSLRIRNKFVVEKLGINLNEKVYFDITQDEHDKKHNSIKCIIKQE